MRIIIAGASSIGRQLLDSLTQDRGHELVVVDADERRCEELAQEYDALVLHGDAANPEILEKAQITGADAVVAATHSDAINTIVAMLARRSEVERIVVTITTDAMRGALAEIGATDIVAPTMAAVAEIEAALHGAEQTHLGRLLEGGLHLAEMRVGDGADGTRLGDNTLPDATVAVAYLRDDDLKVALPDTELRKGDVVLALSDDERTARKAHQALE